jgi:integrase
MSLRQQAAFGLRREESIEVRPEWADRGNVLLLKASWTKGGKERKVPIPNETQRDVLNRAKALAGAGSLIPAALSYRDQLNRFKAQTARAGIDHLHGLRRSYAQARHEELDRKSVV